MRPKFVLSVVLVFLVMAVAVLLRSSKPLPPSQTTAPSVVVAPAASAVNLPPPLPLPAPVAVKPPPQTEEKRQDAIDKERDRLSDLQTSQDPQALSNILADLYSPEKEIRQAAIDAAEQVHNTNAIPVLKSIAMTNEDTDEQMALLDAAKFIATPLGDLSGGAPPTPQQIQAAQQRRAQDLARPQAQMQGPQPNSSPSLAPAPSPPAGN